MARFLRTDTNSSGGHSRLRKPIAVKPAFNPETQRIRTVRVTLVKVPPLPFRGAKSRLEPPAVVAVESVVANLIPGGPGVRLAPSSSGEPKSKLYPPQVVNAAAVPFVAAPIKVELARIRPQRTQYRLGAPVVVYVIPLNFGPGVRTTTSRPPRVIARLDPPTVVTQVQTATFSGPHVAALAKIKPPPVRSRLDPPTVIDLRPQTYFVRVDLARIRPQPIHSILREPTDTIGPEDSGRVKITLAPQKRGTPESRLRGPVVIDLRPQTYFVETKLVRIRPVPVRSALREPTDLIDSQDLGFIAVTLAPQKRGLPKSHLTLTAIIDLRPQVYSVAVTLAPQERGAPKSRLSPPAVVTTAAVAVYFGPKVTLAHIRPVRTLARLLAVPAAFQPVGFVGVTLAPSFRGKARSRLSLTAIIDLSPQTYFIATILVRIRPVRTIWALRKPTDLVDTQDLGAVAITLAPSFRGKPKPRLLPVPAAFQPVGVVAVTLAYSLRGTPKSELRPPVVIDLTPQTYFVSTAFVRIRPVPVRSVLREPTDLIDTQDLGFIAVTLAPQKRGLPKSRLSLTAIIDLSPQTYFIATILVRIRPQPTTVRLHPPTDLVDAQDLGHTRITLAPQKRGVPRSELRGPIVIGGGIAFGGPRVRLTAPRDRTAPVESRLRPPTVITPVTVAIFFGPKAEPARIRPVVVYPRLPTVVYTEYYEPIRGFLTPVRDRNPRAIWRLSPPAVVSTGVVVVYFGPKVEPVRIRPARTLARLLPVPAAFQPVGSVAVTLAYQSRRPGRVELRGPVVIDLSPQVYTIATTLARIRPVPTRWAIRKPTDLVDQQDLGSVAVTLAPSFRGKPKSILRGPIVIDLRPQVYFPAVTLAYSLRGRPKSVLRPPVIPPVAPPIDFEIAVQLTRARLERRLAIYRLGPPVVIDLTPQTFFIATTFVRITPPPTMVRLFPPTDLVDTQDLGSVSITLAPQKRGVPKSHLTPPIVIDLRPQTYFIAATLVRITPPPVRSVLREPTDLNDSADLGFIAITLAPSFRGKPKSTLREPTDLVDRDDSGYVRVRLAYQSRRPGRAALRAPIVIDLRPQTYYVSVTLVRITPQPTMARIFPPTDLVDRQDLGRVRVTLAPQKRGLPKSRLEPPTLIDLRPQTYYLAVSLAPSFRGKPKSILGKPTDLIDTQDLGFVKVHLAYQSRRPGRVRLLPPTVIDLRPQTYFIATTLVQIKPPPVRSALRVPTVTLEFVATPISTTLVRIRPVPTRKVLAAPKVVYDIPLNFGPGVRLAPSSLGTPKSRLFPPTVLAAAVFAGPHGALAKIKPPPVKSSLRPPALIDLRPQTFYLSLTLAPSRFPKPKSILRFTAITFRPQFDTTVLVHLAYQSRGIPKSKLRAPAVVGAGIYFRGIVVKRAPSRFPVPKSRLLTPTRIVQTFRIPVVAVHLVRIRPVAVHSRIEPPTDLVDRQDLGFIRVHLAPATRPKPKSHLSAPTVVGPVLARPVDEELTILLAQSYRPETRSKLSAPVVISRVLARAILVSLAPSSFGKSKPKLLPPAVVTKVTSPPLEVHLAYSVRGRAKSILRKPTLIDLRPQTYYLAVTLAPQKRGTPKPFLREPTDLVDRMDLGFVRVHLAPSFRGKPKSKLRPPTVVARFQARPVDVTLAPQRRGAPKSFLRPPTVLVQPVVHEAIVHFARIRPSRTIWFLRPPAVVSAPPAVIYYGPRVTLVRIRPVPVLSMLTPGLAGHVCYGIVCGYDYAAKVTGSDSGPKVTGSDTGAKVTGSDTSAKVTGATGSRGNVSGGDERREGC